jgi:hypothetical protein
MFKQPQSIVILALLVTHVLVPINQIQAQAIYSSGDILDIESLNLAHFETNESLDLTIFEGKILYLEWFYWW